MLDDDYFVLIFFYFVHHRSGTQVPSHTSLHLAFSTEGVIKIAFSDAWEQSGNSNHTVTIIPWE